MAAKNKVLIASFLTSLLLSTHAYSQSEEQIADEVSQSLPEVKDLQDRSLLRSFLRDNFESLKPETIESVEALLAPKKIDFKKKLGGINAPGSATWAQPGGATTCFK